MDGLRILQDGREVQRYLCRCCGRRFSEEPLNTQQGIETSAKYALDKGAKNLSSATEIKTVAGDIERRRTFAVTRNLDLVNDEARGLLTKFMAYLEREGFDSENQYPTTLGHLVKDGACLLDPENVKSVIATQRKKIGEPWSDSMKMLAVYAYDAFCAMQGIVWKRPVYHQNEATVPVPDEKDLDLLINAARRKMATFLLCLKETFADPSEIVYAEWIDLAGDVLSINHPVKGHLPGKYQLSSRLIAMLNALPRKNKRIFATTYKNLYSCLENLRSKAAEKFQNPALKQISFKSFRHWGGSMIAYYSNGNPLVIMRVLRHKSFESSRKYIHTIEFKDEDFDTATATTPEEIQQLGKAGWTKYDEITFSGVQMHFYRKPKRFGGFKNRVDKDENRVDRFLCSV
jgi:integrase